MKIQDVVKAYRTLAAAKVTKMTVDAKMKVVKSVRALKAVAQEFQEFSELTQEKLKGDDHERFSEIGTRLDSGDTAIDKAEAADTRCYFRKYNAELYRCLHEEELREADVKLAKLSKKEFDDLLASNDFEAGTIADLSEILQ